MTTPKHTKGPWAVSMPGGQTTFNGRRVTVTSHGNMVADLDWNSPAENMANARLIAAAPGLLALLVDIQAWLNSNLIRGKINCGTANRDGDLVSQIAATIAKANNLH